jgi:mono/diheme cytochrome c family protein
MRGRAGLTGALLALLSVLAGPARARSPEALYLLKCSGCHRADGQGAPEAGVPPFPGFVGDLARDPDGRTYMLHVPGVVSSNLPDAELTTVLNYLLDHWSNAPAGQVAPFTAEEVARQRAVPVNDIVKYRRTLVARLRKTGVPVAQYPWP